MPEGADSVGTVLLAKVRKTGTEASPQARIQYDRHNKSKPGYQRIPSEVWFRTFCRTFGLTLLTSAWLPRSQPERQKVVIRQDRRVAAFRAAVHVLPVAGALFLAVLNIRGVFYGPANNWISVLQFVAKAHEMLMQASIAFVVFAFVRKSLISSTKLPFGAMFAGLQVKELSYLWSPEFWSAITSNSLDGVRRFEFAALVLTSCFLAAAVGPSSAIAMIPRQNNFLTGEWPYWFNTSEREIFPNHITTKNTFANCSTVNTSRVYEEAGLCPSRRWQSLQPWLRNIAVLWDEEADTLLSGSSASFPLADDASTEPMQLCNSQTEPMKCPPNAVIATTPFFSIMSLADENTMSYASFNQSYYRYEKLPSIYTFSLQKQPYVASSCVPFDLTDSTVDSITFPSSSMLSQSPIGGAMETSSTDPAISHAEVWDAANGLASSQIIWIDSSLFNFVNTSIAAVVLTPESCGDSCIAAYSCIIRAIWAEGQFNVTRGPYAAYETYQSTSFPSQLNDLSQWPLQTIDISHEWAEFLTPRVFGTNVTIIESLTFDATGDPWLYSGEWYLVEHDDPGYVTENLLSSLVALGLSQHIWPNPIYDEPMPTQQGTFFPFLITIQIPGLAYTMEGYPIKIAVAILVLYCVFAVTHLVYTIVSGVSSSAWDSAPELVALAVNSQPADALEHTGGGIDRMSTFGLPVGIRAVDDHLQLCFGHGRQKDGAKPGQIRANYEYS